MLLKATFLISKNIPSPMGAFLSAFKNKEDAKSSKKKKEHCTLGRVLNHLKINLNQKKKDM